MGNRSSATVRRWATALLVAGMGVVGSASATLMDRGADMVYDDVLDITWTRQAGDGFARTWFDANAWAANLVFGGFDDWRLYYASVTAGAGQTTSVYFCTGVGGADEVACRDNEMGYMFYYNLDGNFGNDKTGTQTAVSGEQLTGIESFYWSDTEFNSFFAWNFRFVGGNQGFVDSFGSFDKLFAWAVRPGDVVAAAIPEPSSLLLFGLGALGLGWARRARRRR